MLNKFNTPNSIAIIFNQDLKAATELAYKIKSHLSQDFEVYCESASDIINKQPLGLEVDLIISVGGDGTILRCAHVASNKEVPILGINMGKVGFLCEIEASGEVANKLTKYLDGSAIIESRSKLKINLQNDNYKKEYSALNDFVIARGSKIRLIDIETSINNKHFATYRGDGVVVSTATGSTAYSLGLGGSIMHPSSNYMIIKPIASHASLNGGLFLEKGSILTLKANTEEDFSVSVDGFQDIQLKEIDRIEIEIDPESNSKFVRSENFRDDYWVNLAKKLDLRKGESLG